MSDSAAQTYIDKWLAAYPAQRLALVFIEPARRQSLAALAALRHELLEAAYAIREPQVAAAKLGWWAEELADAAASGGRHPLIQVLFAADAAAGISAPQWLAPIHAALSQLDAGTPADFAAQVQSAETLHGALAALETAWWFGAGADATRATRMATLGHLLHMVARIGEHADSDRLPLPMTRLARHALDRESLAHDSPARSEALRDQLTDIANAYRQAWTLRGPLSTFSGLDARLGQRCSQRVQRAAQPMVNLHAVQSWQARPTTLWYAWQAARAARPLQV